MNSGMRGGRDGRPQYPNQQGRNGMNIPQQQQQQQQQQPQQQQMGNFPQQGRGAAPQQGQVPQMPQQAMGPSPEAIMSAPPQQQKQLLGEALFPKISNMQPQLAGKITGMLLEMDNTELLGLIDSEDKLREKVEEAMTVYDEYMKNSGGEPEQQEGEAKAEGGEEAQAEGTKA